MMYIPIKNKKIIFLANILLIITYNTFAGIYGRTSHSRANCGNNESITWWSNNPHTWRVISEHRLIGRRIGSHTVYTAYEKTWRSAAVCWGESWTSKEYNVTGYHYEEIEEGPKKKKRKLIARTYAIDCSIYDGWWDE